MPKEKRSKLDNTATRGIFIGYMPTSRQYRILDPKKNTISIHTSVTFDEKKMGKKLYDHTQEDHEYQLLSDIGESRESMRSAGESQGVRRDTGRPQGVAASMRNADEPQGIGRDTEEPQGVADEELDASRPLRAPGREGSVLSTGSTIIVGGRGYQGPAQEGQEGQDGPGSQQAEDIARETHPERQTRSERIVRLPERYRAL